MLVEPVQLRDPTLWPKELVTTPESTSAEPEGSGGWHGMTAPNAQVALEPPGSVVLLVVAAQELPRGSQIWLL